MATIVLGSADAPVILDPAQIITEVHWGSRYIAFSIKINRDPELGWAQEFCGGGDLEPIGLYSGIYLTDLDFISLNENGDFDEARIMTASGWIGLEPGEVSIVGLPSLPAPMSFGYFEVVASAHDDNPATNDNLDTRHPWSWWQEVSGSELKIAVPDGGFFKSATSATFELVGFPFTSGPTCYELRTAAGVFASIAPRGSRQALAGSQSIYSLSGVSVTARGKTYQPIGIELSDHADELLAVDNQALAKYVVDLARVQDPLKPGQLTHGMRAALFFHELQAARFRELVKRLVASGAVEGGPASTPPTQEKQHG